MQMDILIVHEQRTIADHIAEILRTNGRRALPLYGAADALNHLKHIWFDLVILDMRSAGLAKRVLEKPLHPEVIFVDIAVKSDEILTKSRKSRCD